MPFDVLLKRKLKVFRSATLEGVEFLYHFPIKPNRDNPLWGRRIHWLA
jgi:hypothetical protein